MANYQDLDLAVHSRSVTPVSTVGSEERCSLSSTHHSSTSTNSSSYGRRSRNQSESSLSLLESDNEVEDEQQPFNDNAADSGEEEGRYEQEQAPNDQPADEQGAGQDEERGRQQEEQEDDGQQEVGERENEEHADGHAGRNRQPSHRKLREAMQGGFLNDIDVPLGASRNDILYMALSFAMRNNANNSAFCNLINLINNLFVSPVLPVSQYLLDSLLVSDVGVHYYFYCKKCFKSFGELNYKNIKFRDCDICQTQNHISDLRLATFFVVFDLPVQLEIIFQNPETADALCTPAEAIGRSRPGFLSDIYDGSVYREFNASVAHLEERILTMHMSVDGSPIASSSSASIWPILGEIHELPPNVRMKNLLLCGLWFGKSHAKMDLFLQPFVCKMRNLSQGFQLQVGPNISDARLYCTGCCVDSGARGSVQGIKTHGGFFSCNWCKIRGCYIDRAVRYPLSNIRPEDRTHAELVELQLALIDGRAARGENAEQMSEGEGEEQQQENIDDPNGPQNVDMFGINSVSPLINMPQFSMVNGFFVESMHCVDMGVVKAQISLWLEEAGKQYYIKGSLEELNRRILALQPPLEFRRMPRTLKERLNFKAREYNNFLWYSYIILKGILPQRYLNTWLLLIQAIFLLSQAEVSLQHINTANTLIINYLASVQMEYGENHMTYNLHILRHLPDHVRRWGPLWASCAYVFEDGNGHLKNLINTVQCVPHQIVRHWSWDLARNLLDPVVSDKARTYASSIVKPKHHNKISFVTGSCRLVGSPLLINLSEEELFLCEENQQPVENLQFFEKLIYKNCAYVIEKKKCARTCNSVAQLHDKSVVLIRKICYDRDSDRVFLFVSDLNWEPILNLPDGVQMSRDDHCLREIQFVHEELRFIKCTDLKIICFRTKQPHCDLLSVIPNVQNRH